MIELTRHQLGQIATSDTSPPTVVDPHTKAAYVLPIEVYERMRGIFDADDVRLLEPLLAETDPEDWADLSAYEGKP